MHPFPIHTPLGNLLPLFLTLLLSPTQTYAKETQCPLPTPPLLQTPTCPLPIDDLTPPSVRNDWTHDPYCLTLRPHSSAPPDKFCVYTSSTYNLNHGISVIARPDTAATVLAAVRDASLAWGARAHLYDAPADLQAGLPYAVRELPGRGLGVVATRQIGQFEVFMQTFPSLVVDDVFFPRNGTAPAEGPELYRVAVERLSDTSRVVGLARSRRGADVVDDVVRTNAFGVTLNERSHKGLFPETARMNHGCDPNAVVRSTPATLGMRAIAIRDIAEGEEILISYIPLGLVSARRTMALSQLWGFHCGCSMCTASSEEKKASDRRRERMVEIQRTIQYEKVRFEDIVRLSEEFLDIVMKEKLVAKYVEYFAGFMNLYFEWGDLDGSIRYGELGLYYLESFSDPDNPQVVDMRKNLDWLKLRRDRSQ